MKSVSAALAVLLQQVKRKLRKDPESPEDPYSYVGAPKTPRIPGRRASAAAPLE